MVSAQYLLAQVINFLASMFRPPLYNFWPDLVTCAEACMRVNNVPSIDADVAEIARQCADTCLLLCATIHRDVYLPQRLARQCCHFCEACEHLVAQLNRPEYQQCAKACRECALKLRAGL